MSRFNLLPATLYPLPLPFTLYPLPFTLTLYPLPVTRYPYPLPVTLTRYPLPLPVTRYPLPFTLTLTRDPRFSNAVVVAFGTQIIHGNHSTPKIIDTRLNIGPSVGMTSKPFEISNV